MSSYFDTMGSAYNNPALIVKLVYKQYGNYLDQLSLEVLKRDQERFLRIHTAFIALEEEATEWVKAGPPTKIDHYQAWHYEGQKHIQKLHDLGHFLGSAGIALKGGRLAVDNPRLMY